MATPPLPPTPLESSEPGSTRPVPNLEFKAAVLLLFTLGNSTDAFLLLRLGVAGISAGTIALLWAAHRYRMRQAQRAFAEAVRSNVRRFIEDGKVLRQIPGEEVLRIARAIAKLQEGSGGLMQEVA